MYREYRGSIPFSEAEEIRSMALMTGMDWDFYTMLNELYQSYVDQLGFGSTLDWSQSDVVSLVQTEVFNYVRVIHPNILEGFPFDSVCKKIYQIINGVEISAFKHLKPHHVVSGAFSFNVYILFFEVDNEPTNHGGGG